MRSIVTWALALAVLSVAASGCSSSDDAAASGSSVVGAWEYVDGATTINLDLQGDGTCAYALRASAVQTCDKCTYTFEGGVLAITFPASGQKSTGKAELDGADTLRLEGAGGVIQSYKKRDFPAAVRATCK